MSDDNCDPRRFVHVFFLLMEAPRINKGQKVSNFFKDIIVWFYAFRNILMRKLKWMHMHSMLRRFCYFCSWPP